MHLRPNVIVSQFDQAGPIAATTNRQNQAGVRMLGARPQFLRLASDQPVVKMILEGAKAPPRLLAQRADSPPWAQALIASTAKIHEESWTWYMDNVTWYTEHGIWTIGHVPCTPPGRPPVRPPVRPPARPHARPLAPPATPAPLRRLRPSARSAPPARPLSKKN